MQQTSQYFFFKRDFEFKNALLASGEAQPNIHFVFWKLFNYV